jgi:hypothetical protein
MNIERDQDRFSAAISGRVSGSASTTWKSICFGLPVTTRGKAWLNAAVFPASPTNISKIWVGPGERREPF